MSMKELLCAVVEYHSLAGRKRDANREVRCGCVLNSVRRM